MTSSHKHRCGNCGCVWEHPDTCHDDAMSHLCPKCGVMFESWRYKGPIAPMFTFDGPHGDETITLLELRGITVPSPEEDW
jgi:hypothetical protein